MKALTEMQQRWAATARKRRVRKLRVVQQRVGCHRHIRDDLLTLHDEPNGSNPPKLIGFVCRSCSLIFTAAGTPSSSTVPTRPKIPNSPLRPSRSHAARLRAADRLGLAVDARRAA